MADIQLSNGRIWYNLDYQGEKYDKTVASQSDRQFQLSSPQNRKKAATDLKFPYIGSFGEYPLAGAVEGGTAISRDRIDTDMCTGWLFSTREERILGNIDPNDFKKIFAEKYRKKYEDTSIAFLDANTPGIFPRGRKKKESIYDSSTDILVVSNSDSIDSSFDELQDVRQEVENDLQRLADKALEQEEKS